MNELGKKLQITDLSGLYNITKTSIANHGGRGLLKRYNNSVSNLLKTVYPEYHPIDSIVDNHPHIQLGSYQVWENESRLLEQFESSSIIS